MAIFKYSELAHLSDEEFWQVVARRQARKKSWAKYYSKYCTYSISSHNAKLTATNTFRNKTLLQKKAQERSQYVFNDGLYAFSLIPNHTDK
jgi:hypothetical protein